MRLTDYKILTFDVYGTLIDWESGIVNSLSGLTDQVPGDISRDEILEAHAYFESSAQHWTPAKSYSDLLATVYRRLAEHWQISVSWEDCVTYGQSVGNWPAFSDSAASLQYLKEHFLLAVLTNTDNQNFSGSQAQLGVTFDGIYTAEDIGSYKPADRNFEFLIETLAHRGIQKTQILHVAESMFHDHGPANRHEIANCWIYRRHDQSGFGATMNPGDLPTVDFTFNSLSDFVAAHQKEIG